MATETVINWEDRSDEDEEQYRFLIPNVILADLWHAQYEDFSESVDHWRLNLSKRDALSTLNGSLITADHSSEDGIDVDAAKAWAEPLITEFMEQGR